MRIFQNGTSLLGAALSNPTAGTYKLAEKLKALGFDVDLANFEGYTTLHELSKAGNIKAVTFLLKTLGANPHAGDWSSATALHAACESGYTALARLLIQEFSLDCEAVDF